jgi:hypothetical protein
MNAPQDHGRAATLSDPLQNGLGAFIGSPFYVQLDGFGYLEHEHEATGDAVSFTASETLGADGRWSLGTGSSAPYRTRVLVRRPADPARGSGTAVVEWLNVSGGVDADPLWINAHEEILRRGHIWVGVSAQRIGVVGGPVLVEGPDVPERHLAGKGLRGIDPERYGRLEHPGDGFAFDIYSQVGRALRTGELLGGAMVERIFAAGQSQSAIALVTHYNSASEDSPAFDGYFVLSRGAFAMPFVEPGEHADIASSMMGGVSAIFRTDRSVPVIDVQSEADLLGVLNSHLARQPDDERFRLWEVAGTAHADAHLLGPTAAAIDCGAPINDGPMHIVVKSALRALEEWVRDGAAPPSAPRIELTTGSVSAIRRDGDGIAVGGLRTPPVDVPVATLSGEPGPSPSMLCLLLGQTTAFSPERLRALYASPAEYLELYRSSADATIKAGLALAEDRDALMAFAHPAVVPG